MDAVAILDELDKLGISAWVAGDQIRLKPFSQVPADLLDELKAHKREALSVLKCRERPKHSEAEVTRRLQEALERKKQEIASDKRYLLSLLCARPELTEPRIAYLEGHVREIGRYLDEGGTLELPRCCKQAGWTCLLAAQGLTDCAMFPECGYSLRL